MSQENQFKYYKTSPEIIKLALNWKHCDSFVMCQNWEYIIGYYCAFESEKMETDIYQKLEIDFGDEMEKARDIISGIEAESKGLVSDRIIRACIFLAEGNVKDLEQIIRLARTNSKDVIRQAEHNDKGQPLYDFNQTFHELGLILI